MIWGNWRHVWIPCLSLGVTHVLAASILKQCWCACLSTILNQTILNQTISRVKEATIKSVSVTTACSSLTPPGWNKCAHVGTLPRLRLLGFPSSYFNQNCRDNPKQTELRLWHFLFYVNEISVKQLVHLLKNCLQNNWFYKVTMWHESSSFFFFLLKSSHKEAIVEWWDIQSSSDSIRFRRGVSVDTQC